MADVTMVPKKIKYPKLVKSRRVKHRRSKRTMGGTIGLFIFLTIVGAIMALPLIYAIMAALKPPEEFFLFPPRFFVLNPTGVNFRNMGDVISNLQIPFERYLFNSIWISAVTTAIYLLLSTMAAYPLAKHDFPGRKGMNATIQLALMFTSAITAVPQYVVLASLGLINHPLELGIIMPAMASTLGVFLCVQYLEVIPKEIIESGKIDGAGEMRIYWKIVMPNCKPIIMTILIFQFQGIWSASGTNIVFTEAYKTLPAALSQIATAGLARAGVGAAAALILMIPPVLVFAISQANVIETMTHSGIKG